MVINVRCLVIVLLMMIFTGCGMQPQSDNKPNDNYSVVDDYGNVLRFDSKPKKIYAGTLSIVRNGSFLSLFNFTLFCSK